MRFQKTGGKGEHWASTGMKLSLAAKLRLMMESHLVSILETLGLNQMPPEQDMISSGKSRDVNPYQQATQTS
jgi:hypothetical protein